MATDWRRDPIEQLGSPEEWSQTELSLRLALSDLSFSTIMLKVSARQVRGTQEPLQASDLPRLRVLLQNFPEGILLSSYPVAQPLPTISWLDGVVCYTLRQYNRYYIDLTT